LLGVEAELQHVVGARAPRELGVDRLVSTVGLPLEEVGVPVPGSIAQVALVDVPFDLDVETIKGGRSTPDPSAGNKILCAIAR
jgi:hypothetical protein